MTAAGLLAAWSKDTNPSPAPPTTRTLVDATGSVELLASFCHRAVPTDGIYEATMGTPWARRVRTS